MQHSQYVRKEVAARGRAIYEQRLRALSEPENIGKYLLLRLQAQRKAPSLSKREDGQNLSRHMMQINLKFCLPPFQTNDHKCSASDETCLFEGLS